VKFNCVTEYQRGWKGSWGLRLSVYIIVVPVFGIISLVLDVIGGSDVLSYKGAWRGTRTRWLRMELSSIRNGVRSASRICNGLLAAHSINRQYLASVFREVPTFHVCHVFATLFQLVMCVRG